MQDLLDALRQAEIEVLVDVRAFAGSRRPGFAKTRLSTILREARIEYLHLRGLGTPAEGRAAARAGRHDEMRSIFRAHLESPEAGRGLEDLVEIVRSGRRVALLCLEADPRHCHRSLVADAVAARVPLALVHLRPGTEE